MAAVAVEQHGAVGDHVVDIGRRWKLQFPYDLIVQPLADDGAFDNVGSRTDSTKDFPEVRRIHQLQTIDQGGVSEGMEVVIVVCHIK
jgi:hypothetical protein